PVVSGPPGLLANEHAQLMPPAYDDAPIQSDTTPGLGLLHLYYGRQEIQFRTGTLTIDIDGSIAVAPLYSIFTLRFGGRDPYAYELRQAVASSFEYRAGLQAQYRAAAMEFALS